MDDEIQTWWEIPSIVHFCKVFTHITKDISKIGINEFENAIRENSYLLTDMAIRFTKVCGFYDPNTNEWWNIMKKNFQIKCNVYNFKYSLDSATNFDDLTRKQKVEALYIFCNLILDVEHIQNKLSNSPNIRRMLNVKPLGYDLNKSVYWYFGSNKLYREDFEKSFGLSTNLPVDNNVHRRIQYEPYPSGVFGPGKWNKICNNINDWYSLADITEYSKNINIKYLHKAISNIILNLPKLKENKSCYSYIKPLRSICTRRLRSMDVIYAEPKKNISNLSIIQPKQYSHNVMENLTKQKNDSTVSQRNETSNLKVYDQNQNVSYAANVFNNDITQIEELKNKTAFKLKKNGNEKMLDKSVKKNIVFDRVFCIKIKRWVQESTHHSSDFKRKLRSSTNRTKTL